MLERNKPFRTWAFIFGLIAVARLVWSLNDVTAPTSVCYPPVVLWMIGAALLGAQEIVDGMRK